MLKLDLLGKRLTLSPGLADKGSFVELSILTAETKPFEVCKGFIILLNSELKAIKNSG